MSRVSAAVIALLLVAALAPRADCSEPFPQSAVANSFSLDSDLRKAKGLIDSGEFDAAETLTRRIIAQHSNSADSHFLLGLIFFRQVQAQTRSAGSYVGPGDVPANVLSSEASENKIRASLAEFTEGAKYGKPSAHDLKIVSLDYILLGDYSSADKWLSLSLQWDPGDGECWYYLGRTKYNENRFEEAIKAFEKSLELRPRNALAADGLGLSHAGLNHIADAIASFQNAISWQHQGATKSPEPFIDLGDFFNQQGRFDEALSVLQQAVIIAPKNIRAHETLGKTFLNLNRLPDAQRELESAISSDPDRAALHYLLGQIYRKQGFTDKAKVEMTKFQELKAKEPPAKSGMD